MPKSKRRPAKSAPAPVLITFAASVNLAAGAGPLRVRFAAGDKPTVLTGPAVPLGVPSDPAADGNRYQFNGPPANMSDLIDVVKQHNTDEPIGRLAQPLQLQGNVLHAKARLFATSVAQDVAVEAAEGTRASFSIGAVFADPVEPDAQGVYQVPAEGWSADHLGVVRFAAFGSATGVTVNHSRKDSPMPKPQDHKPAGTADDDAGAASIMELDSVTVADLAAQVAGLLGKPNAAHPLAKFASLGAFAAAYFGADETEQTKLAVAFKAAEPGAARFAVADQTLNDSPGLNVPAWRTSVVKYLETRQPLLSRFGRSTVDAMTVNWPYLDPDLDLDTIITKQAAEKDELSGVKVKVKQGSTSINSAGAVSDISYQILKLGRPEYLSLYLQVVMAAWARYEERLTVMAALAASNTAGTNTAAFPSITTEKAVKSWLTGASMKVEDACGAPANVVQAGDDVFLSLAGMEWGKDKGTGSSLASTLRVNVSGLEVERNRFLPAGAALVTHSDAAKFASTGPMFATAEDVRKLGRDVAIWGMVGEKLEAAFPKAILTYGDIS